MNIGAIVQARMGSTRLPGKVMLDLCGKPVIYRVIERLKQCKYLDDIVIATTTSAKDAIIAEKAREYGAKCFKGSEEDVLSRFYFSAKDHYMDAIIRITCDCPLIDPLIIDAMIEVYKSGGYELVTNDGPNLQGGTYPRGLDVDVFSFEILENAYHHATQKYHREHVVPYFFENSKKIYYFKNDTDYSYLRWTLDTWEDFELIQAVYRYLYNEKHLFYFSDILRLLEEHPELSKINSCVEQKKVQKGE